MNRRDFIKRSAGVAAATATLPLLTDCTNKHTAGKEQPSGEMTKRLNPNTGDKVSLLGYGMMRLPVVDGTSARESKAEIDQEQVNAQVDYAIAHGVNLFDTSPAYCQGMSETATGIALSRYPRESYYISTKLSNFSPDTWSRKESQDMFNRSLKYLQTDYVDYLLMHGIGMSAQGKDAMQAFYARYMDNGILDWLVEQKQKGRLRNLGFSYHGDIKVFDMLMQWHDEGKYHWDFALIEMNYLDWRYANEINPRNTDAEYLYGELNKRGIPALVMEPLLGGRLATQPEGILRKMLKQNPDMTPAQWSFRFVGTHEGVLSVLSGMTKMEHLKENVGTYSPLVPLAEHEYQFLLELAEDVYNMKAVPCTACNYCMPCPYGLNIPAIFAYYNRCLSEGLTPVTSGGVDTQFKRDRRHWLIGYDRAVPRMRQAAHCIGCRECVSHCPQRIQIPEQMRRIDEYVESLKKSE